METTVYFNPHCSKCRTTQGILAERGVDADYVRYLDNAPDRADLERVMGLLGIDDPRQMMRTGEPVYKELGLADADRDRLLDAMANHPILIERPIVIRGGRAVIARPPERVLELLEGSGAAGSGSEPAPSGSNSGAASNSEAAGSDSEPGAQ